MSIEERLEALQQSLPRDRQCRSSSKIAERAELQDREILRIAAPV